MLSDVDVDCKSHRYIERGLFQVDAVFSIVVARLIRFYGFEECFNRSIEAPIFVNTDFSVFLACKDG